MNEREEFKEQLEEELQWVKYRVSFLDIIESKLLKMKQIAEQAKDENLNQVEREKLNKQINILAMQVKALDEESKNIWNEE